MSSEHSNKALLEKIEKLQHKLEKERTKYEKELAEKANTITLLQKTLHEIQELYQRTVQELEEEKKTVKKLQEKSKEAKKRMKEMQTNSVPDGNDSPPETVTPTDDLSRTSSTSSVSKSKGSSSSISLNGFLPNGSTPTSSPNGTTNGDQKPKTKFNTVSSPNKTRRGSTYEMFAGQQTQQPQHPGVVSHSQSTPVVASTSTTTTPDRKLASKSRSFQGTDNNSNAGTGNPSDIASISNNTISPDDERKLQYTLSSTALNSEAGYAGKKLTITVSSPELTLTTTVFSNWTVSETRVRLARKFPGATSNYALYLKTKGKDPKLMEDDKILADYKLLEDPKAIVLFQAANTIGRKKGSTIKRIGSLTRDKTTEEDAKLDEVLYDAIQKQDIFEIERILSKTTKLSLEEHNKWGLTPLHAAIRSNNISIVKMFLDYYQKMNLDINIPDNHGWTALHYAVSNNTGNDSDEEILNNLLHYPGLIVDVENSDKNTPMHYFCQRFISPKCSVLGELMIRKAPSLVNRKNKNGETPLHKAIFNPAVRVLMVKMLLKNNANVNIPTAIGGETALHYAVRLGRADLVKILLQSGADFTLGDAQENKTPYEWAVQTNQKEIAQILKDAHDLQKWLIDLRLESYLLSFLKEELWLEMIASIEPNSIDSILDTLKMNNENERAALKKAYLVLREKYSQREFMARLKKAVKKSNVHDMFGTPPGSEDQIERIDRLKRSLAQIQSNVQDSDWIISHSELEFTKELGAGTSATVFKGLYKDDIVAIKVMKAQNKEHTYDEFKKELRIMSSVRFPHIVHFYGACLEPRICIVLEYCKRGSLYSVLKDARPLYLEEVGWEKAFKFCIEMSAAVNFLHTFDPPIFHRDLKSLNLLITESWDVKLCDFGLARFVESANMDTMNKMCGTYAYAAPELYSGSPFTDKCDVYSMGIILWEVFSRIIRGKHESPYAEYTYLKMDYQVFFHAAKKELRPTIPPTCNEALTDLIKRCTSGDPTVRPSANQILTELALMQNDFRKNPSTWQSSCVWTQPDSDNNNLNNNNNNNNHP